MYFGPPPQVIETEIFSTLPEKLRAGAPGSSSRKRRNFLEGPSFDREGNLYCVDIPMGRVYRISPHGEWDIVVEYDGEPNGLKIDREGRMFIADHRQGILLLDPKAGKVVPYLEGPSKQRFKGVNDLIFAKNGDLYFTDQGSTGLHDPTGCVYRYTTAGKLECLIDTVPSPNGIVFNRRENEIFVAVTRANAVWRVPLDEATGVSKVGLFVQLHCPGPDGLALDEEGNVAVTHPGLGLVWLFSKRGEPLYQVKSCGGEMTTNCAYGGADRKTLYVVDSAKANILAARMPVAGKQLVLALMMKRIALLAWAFSGAIPGISPAAEYPEKPIRLVVPYAPGGNADIMARTVGERLGRNLGRQVIVDNRPGANSIIGTEAVARATPDGYTILLVASSHATNPSMVKLPYDTLGDFAPLSLVGSTPLILVAHPSLPVATVKELLAFARSKPGQLNFGSSGNGSPANLAGALFNIMGGTKLVHVPYRGTTQATTDVMAGNVQLAFPSMTSVLPHVRTGKLKALGITAAKRSPLAPELPTVSEAGLPGYQASIWNAMLAPAATPKPIVSKLNSEIVRVLNAPETRERFAGIGADITGSSPEELKAYIETEMKKWSKVIRESGIKVDLER